MTPTINTIDWQGITLSVTYEENAFGLTWVADMEIRSINPEKAPLPITNTGYRSHFPHPDNVKEAGGADAYVIAWLEEAAKSPEWCNRKTAPNQLSLF